MAAVAGTYCGIVSLPEENAAPSAVVFRDRDALRKRPSEEEWEAIRPMVVSLHSVQKFKISDMISFLERQTGLLITTKPLKTKLDHWGMTKNLNAEDAAELTYAGAQLQNSKRKGHMILRGRIETLQRVDKYRKRATRRADIATSARPTQRLQNVIVLSRCPSLRSHEAERILHNFENLLREVHIYLQKAHATSFCIPGIVDLDWSSATKRSCTATKMFKQYIWESTKAFHEQDMVWAGTCWRLAHLILEQLVRFPDLGTWIVLIRSCIHLGMVGLADIGQALILTLASLRYSIPMSAAHRPLLDALVEVTYVDLVAGGRYLLEAKLRMIENLWPEAPASHITSILELTVQYPDVCIAANGVTLPDPGYRQIQSIEDVQQRVVFESNRISVLMLKEDYCGSEIELQRCKTWLQNTLYSTSSDPKYQKLYALISGYLGNVQYLQGSHRDAYQSYKDAVDFSNRYFLSTGQHPLGAPNTRRVCLLLLWLSHHISNDETSAAAYADVKGSIELSSATMVGTWADCVTTPIELQDKSCELSWCDVWDGRTALETPKVMVDTLRTSRCKTKAYHPPRSSQWDDWRQEPSLYIRDISDKYAVSPEPEPQPRLIDFSCRQRPASTPRRASSDGWKRLTRMARRRGPVTQSLPVTTGSTGSTGVE